VREECDAEHEESDAFYDCTVCGEGWTVTELDYDVDLDGRIEVTRVDPLEMDVDPAASRKNHADAKWMCRSKVYERRDALALWPEGEFASPAGTREPDSPVDVIAAAFYRADSGSGGRDGGQGDKVIVHDFQWWEHEPVYRVPVAQLGPERAFLMVNAPDAEGAFLLPAHRLQPDAQGLSRDQFSDDPPAHGAARGRLLAPRIALVRLADTELLAHQQAGIGLQRHARLVAAGQGGHMRSRVEDPCRPFLEHERHGRIDELHRARRAGRRVGRAVRIALADRARLAIGIQSVPEFQPGHGGAMAHQRRP